MAECQYDTIVITSNGGSAGVGGTYTKNGTFNSYSLFENANGWQIKCSPAGPPGWANWQVLKESVGFYTLTNLGPDQSDCPPEGQSSDAGGGAAGNVTLAYGGGAPSGPTYALPADVVALITSRFGTVANFLRLRNQGQV
jgi:hypothetical protein